ncbi:MULTISPECIES: YolA family protein [Luteibacter]|uniref:YolA family protein n=1 Tax=Luteibacter TaxID=242605 RepID=UPI0018CE84B1|nr:MULTISPECIES: YolA family protein [unclassified Luteibacter]
MNSVRFLFCTMTLSCTPVLGVHAQEAFAVPRHAMTAMPSLTAADNEMHVPIDAQSVVPVPRAPAPGLSSVRVLAVGSTACGWEYPDGKGTTTCNHGGGELRVAVMEIGYGSNPIASMNGGQLPRSAQYASTGICVTGTQYTWPCTPGQTVVGWLNEYNVDGYESGLFKYQNTSTNAPHNTVYTQINIL